MSISNNILRGNTSTATTGGFTGIQNSGAVVTTININSNQLGNASGGCFTSSVATSGNFFGIVNSGAAATCAVSINSNDFRGITYSVTSTSQIQLITSSAATANGAAENISSNTFTNLNINTTGTFFFITKSNSMAATGSHTVNGNAIVGTFNRTGVSGTVVCFQTSSPVSATGSSSNVTNNNFSNITVTGTTIINGLTVTEGGPGANPTKTITGNTLNSWTGATGSITAMNVNGGGNGTLVSNNTITNIANQAAITCITIGATNNAALETFSFNTINNITSSGTAGTILGITGGSATITTLNINNNTINNMTTSTANSASCVSINSTSGITVNIFRNKIYNLSNTSTGNTSGVILANSTAASTTNFYNNLLAQVYCQTTTFFQGVRGINISSVSIVNFNLYFNTVYLDGTSPTQTYCVYMNSVNPTVKFDNNIFENNVSSDALGQFTYFRVGTLTATFSTASNNNILYCRTPGPSHLIYADGAVNALTNTQQTLNAFKAFAGPTRENLSYTELSPFLNTNGALANFLKINGVASSFAESGGQSIFTNDDFSSNAVRTGYPQGGQANGGGFAPDLGAFEYDGTKITSAGVTAFVAPIGSCSLSASTTITVTVVNSGVTTINSGTNIPMSYTINGGSPVNEVLTLVSNLNPASTINFSFSTTANLSSGLFTIVVTASLVGDNFPGDNSINTTVGNLSGTISVPGTFATLTGSGGLFDAINQAGLSGNLIVNITADITESGAIGLNQWAECGAGGYTLKIQPSGGARVLSGNLGGGTLFVFNGADRVTIDGNISGTRSLTFTNTSPSGAVTMELRAPTVANVCDQFTLKNCIIQGGSVASGIDFVAGGAGFNTVGGAHTTLLLENNIFEKAYNGISLYGAGSTVPTMLNGVTITNNIVGPSAGVGANSIGNNGIYAVQVTNITISGNTVQNINGTTGFAAFTNGVVLAAFITATVNNNTINNIICTNNNASGIHLVGSSTFGLTNSTATISNNKISNINPTGFSYTTNSGGKGILLSDNLALTNLAYTIFNNTILGINGLGSTVGVGEHAGIYVGLNSQNVKIYHNSINMIDNYSSSLANIVTAGLGIGLTCTQLDIRNNIFVNGMTNIGAGLNPQSFAIYSLTANTGFTTINNNDYWSLGAQGRLGFLAANQLTLAGWQGATGQDAASLNVDPLYTTSTLLVPTSIPMNDAGTNAILGTVPNDILSVARPGGGATNVDMGAYEFTPSPDLGVTILVAPSISGCTINNANITFRVKNYFNQPHNFTTNPSSINYSVSGTNGNNIGSTNFNIPLATPNLAAGATLDFNVATNYNMTSSGTYVFNASTTTTGDLNNANDAMSPSVTINNVAPQVVNYLADFNTTAELFLPSGWSADNNSVFQDFSVRTAGGIFGGAHGTNNSPGVGGRMSVGNPTSFLIAPKVSLAGLPCAKLFFDYRIVNTTGYPGTATTIGVGDVITLQISTDCGSSFSTIMTIDNLNHFVTNNFVTKTFDLTPYVGQNIIIKFNTTWAAGDYYVDIDNFKVADGSLDASVLAVTSPATANYCSNQSPLTVAVSVKNNGCVSISNIPIQYTVNGGAPVNEVMPGPIAAGATVPYTFSTTVNITGGSPTYVILSKTNLVNDIDGSNDQTPFGNTVTMNPNPATPTPGSNTPVCNGSPINLIGLPNGATSYSWSGPNSFSSISQNPSIPSAGLINAGVYTLTVFNALGCSSSATTNVTVTAQSISATLSGGGNVCVGNTCQTLLVNFTGAWPIHFTYTANGINPVTINGLSGNSYSFTVCPSVSTTYAISNVGNATCSNVGTGTAIVSVNATPVAGTASVTSPTTSANAVICVGGTVDLVLAGFNGTIDWQSTTTPSNVNSWVSTGTVTNTYTSAPLTQNTYFRAVVSTAGCYSVVSNTVAVLMSVTPVVTISSVTNNSMIVSWTPNSSNGGVYTVTIPGAPGSPFVSASSPLTVPNLTSGTTYNVSVSETTPGTCGTAAGTNSATTSCSAPSVVSFANITNGSADLSWTGSGPFTIYYRNITSGVLATSTVNVATNTFTLTGLQGSSTYAIYVTNNCGSFNPMAGPTSYLTTVGTPCGIPTGVTATVLCSKQLSISWTAVSGISNYNVTYKRMSLPTGLTTVVVSGATNVILNTVPGQNYEIYVRSQCSISGISAPSVPALQTMPNLLPAPDNVVISAPTCHSFTISWPAVAGAGGYVIEYERTVGGPFYNTSTTLTSINLPNSASGIYSIRVAARENCTPSATIVIGNWYPDNNTGTQSSLLGSTLICRDGDQQEFVTDFGSSAIDVYPNPNAGQFTISFINNNDQEVTYTVTNILGQVVYTEAVNESAGEVKHAINLNEELSAGMYNVTVKSGDMRQTKNIILVKE